MVLIMKYTQKEMRELEKTIDYYIMTHDRFEIKELCKKEEYALNYFVSKAITEISKLEHITKIINDK